jgi:hypothetical protein
MVRDDRTLQMLLEMREIVDALIAERRCAVDDETKPRRKRRPRLVGTPQHTELGAKSLESWGLVYTGKKG